MKQKILIVNSNYYYNISKNLIRDATKILKKNKIKYKIVSVPGILEIPVTISRNIKKYTGFIALGCVVKGKTPHFNFISKSTIDALIKLSIESKKPIGNGILTCMNLSQAIIRSDPKGKKRKGKEAAEATLTVLGILNLR